MMGSGDNGTQFFCKRVPTVLIILASWISPMLIFYIITLSFASIFDQLAEEQNINYKEAKVKLFLIRFEQQGMHSVGKKKKLQIVDKNKQKVSFQQNLPSINKAHLARATQLSADMRQRRSTFHYQNEQYDQKIQRRTYKFSETVKKTKKTTRFKNLWISKRGTRNFYIMENQDHVLIDEKTKDYRLYAILDGHGKYGKLIAETAANKIASRYSSDQKNIEKVTQCQHNQKLMQDIIEDTNKALCQGMQKEVSNSGCTLLAILIRDGFIQCFNIGSSRAVLGLRLNLETEANTFQNEEDNCLIAMPLSTDQNLGRFDEKYRVLQTNAVLEELKDESGCRIGPERIWKKGEKYPGIYITRSLGMRLSEELGIISEPEVTTLKLQKGFQFILACSDGFWEVFSNDEAIDYLYDYWREQNLEKGLDELLDEAVRRWDKKSELMDDISIIIIRI